MKKLIIQADNLKPALKHLGLAIIKNPVTPVLSNLFCRAKKDELELTATDLELTISWRCSCECKEEFDFLLPFEWLSRLMPFVVGQPLVIDINRNKATVATEEDVYHLTLDPVDNYPKIPDIPKKNSLELDETFMDWLLRSMATASKDDSRPAMTKACLELSAGGITIVSTNSHALFKYRIPMEVPTTETILISPKIGLALEDLKKATIRWHSHHVAFQSDNITVISTRHSDKYPDWKVVIPQTKANLKVNRFHLINSVNKCFLSSGERLRFVFEPMETRNSKFKLVAMNDDLGRDSMVSVVGEYTGSCLEIAFTPQMMKTVLSQVEFDELNLHIDTAIRGVVLTADEDENYMGLIMPLMS